MIEQDVTLRIDKDEWYPVFSIVRDDANYATPCTLPASLAKRARKAHDEFMAVQSELEAIFDKAAQS